MATNHQQQLAIITALTQKYNYWRKVKYTCLNAESIWVHHRFHA